MFSLVPGSNVALIVEGLCKTYGKAIAVGPLSFSLTVGSTTGLLGGNGAGKTTTIGMIMGLIEPTSGSIRVFGHDMAHERRHVLGRMRFGLELTPNSADGVAFCDIELDAECAGEGCPEISGGQLHFEGAAMGAPVLEVSDQPQRKRLGIDAVLKLGAFKLPACHAIALVGIPAGRICADREACGSAEGRSPGMAR